MTQSDTQLPARLLFKPFLWVVDQISGLEEAVEQVQDGQAKIVFGGFGVRG